VVHSLMEVVIKHEMSEGRRKVFHRLIEVVPEGEMREGGRRSSTLLKKYPKVRCDM